MNTKTMLDRVDWFQTITALAVLIGLGLVIAELRQTRSIAEAQYANDTYFLLSEQIQPLLEGEILDARVKDCFNEPLSRKETMVLHWWRIRAVNVVEREKWLSDLVTEKDWRPNAEANFGLVFSTSGGKRWWERVSRFWAFDPDIVAVGNKVLENFVEPGGWCSVFIEAQMVKP